MIRLWAPAINHRMRFVAACVFDSILAVEHALVEAPKDAHIVYDTTANGPGLHVIPSGVMQDGAMERNPQPGPRWGDTLTLFPTGGDLGFDVFGAVLFLVTRMEEYGAPPLDAHGRFSASVSWMGKHGVLEVPLVDRWAVQLRDALRERFPELTFPERSFSVVSTVDVDGAYAYAHKGLKRTLGGFAKDAVRGDWANARRRMRVLRGKDADPFDTYDTILNVHAKCGVAPLFFFLVGDRSAENINLSHRSSAMRALVLDLSERTETGVHPGYSAAESAQVLAMEIGRMSDLKLGGVEHSRYHYLRGRFPEAFSRLAHLGIRHDHTLGFADAFGFRMGTCTPLPFYDLQAEVMTPLILHPTAFMDTTACRYLSLSPEQAVERARELAAQVRAVGGTFEVLWHNETWSERWHWTGWSDVPEKVLNAAQSEG